MNLLDHRRTSPRQAAAYLERESARLGVAVREYELVGCAPADTIEGWPATLAPIAGLKPTQLLDPALFMAAA